MSFARVSRFLFALALVAASACGSTPQVGPDGAIDASDGSPSTDAPRDTAAPDARDASSTDGAASDAANATDVTDATDAGGADGGVVDAGPNGPECTFNADCPSDQRCACDINTGCFCQVGARGTGVSGVDFCQDGNDCASALCVEGPDGGYYCSGPCNSAADCGPNLPVCTFISGLGNICVRQ